MVLMVKNRLKISHTVFIICAVWAFLSMYCAPGRVAVSPEKDTPREIDPRAVEHFVDGVFFDQREDFSAALLSYQEAQLYDSTSSAIPLAIGRSYLRLGKIESGIVSLQKTLKLDPKETAAWELLAQVYVSRKEWNSAEDAFRNVVRLDSNRVDPYYNLALIALRKNEVDEAIVLYEHILTFQQVPDPQVLMSLGEIYMDLRRIDKAAEMYSRLIEINPNDGLGYFGLGLTKEAAGDTVQAVDLFEKTLKFNPELVHVRTRLKQIFLAQKEWDKALSVMQEAVKIDTTDLVGWLEIGEIFRQKGDFSAALDHIEMLKNRFPKDWRVYLDAGHFYLDQPEFNRAFKEFSRVIELSPSTVWGWLYAGISLVHLDSIRSSETYLKNALSMQPENPVGNYYLGTVLAQLNRPDEAVPYLEKALISRPDWVAAMSTLAGTYDSLEMFAISDSLFQASLKLDPENSLLLNNYSYSLSLRGIRLKEALRMATKAFQAEPENGSYLDTLGWIYFKLEQYEEALGYIEKAFSIRTQSAEVAEHLGDVYQKLDMKEKARSAWQKALEIDDLNPDLLRKLGRNIEE